MAQWRHNGGTMQWHNGWHYGGTSQWLDGVPVSYLPDILFLGSSQIFLIPCPRLPHKTGAIAPILWQNPDCESLESAAP